MLLEPSGLFFGSIVTDFGRILGRFWKDFGRFGKNVRAFWVILGLCGLLWAVGMFWADLRKILVGALCCNGIHFELKLLLALLLVFAFFCLLWLAWAGFGLLWLLWLLG